MKPPVAPDAWAALRRFTPARIALGRAGHALPTDEWLRFGVAHAQARDAVHAPFDAAALRAELQALGFATTEVASQAPDRATYLRRPDLGRRLRDADAEALAALGVPPGALAVMVGDGLSAAAVHRQAVPLLRALKPRLEADGFALAPLVLAHQARVALGDAVGAALQAQAVVVLIGERPGLSSPDSLGAYLTWAPRVGRVDAERNCVSNIRPEGLTPEAAAGRIGWLLHAARSLQATGVALKDDSEGAVLPAESRA